LGAGPYEKYYGPNRVYKIYKASSYSASPPACPPQESRGLGGEAIIHFKVTAKLELAPKLA